VLALTVAVAVSAILYFTRVERPVPVLIGAAVFAGAALGLRGLYQRAARAVHRR